MNIRRYYVRIHRRRVHIPWLIVDQSFEDANTFTLLTCTAVLERKVLGTVRVYLGTHAEEPGEIIQIIVECFILPGNVSYMQLFSKTE